MDEKAGLRVQLGAWGLCNRPMGVSQKLGIPFWGVPRIRIIIFWSLRWGSCHKEISASNTNQSNDVGTRIMYSNVYREFGVRG